MAKKARVAKKSTQKKRGLSTSDKLKRERKKTKELKSVLKFALNLKRRNPMSADPAAPSNPHDLVPSLYEGYQRVTDMVIQMQQGLVILADRIDNADRRVDRLESVEQKIQETRDPILASLKATDERLTQATAEMKAWLAKLSPPKKEEVTAPATTAVPPPIAQKAS